MSGENRDTRYVLAATLDATQHQMALAIVESAADEIERVTQRDVVMSSHSQPESFDEPGATAHDAEVIAQCPGVDVEAIERVLTHHIVRKESGGPGCRVVDDNGWQVVEYRCSCGAWFTTDDILGHQAAQIAALAPAMPYIAPTAGDDEKPGIPARPSVSAEQVDDAVRAVSAADGFEYDPDTTTLVVGVLARLGIDVREVPGE